MSAQGAPDNGEQPCMQPLLPGHASRRTSEIQDERLLATSGGSNRGEELLLRLLLRRTHRYQVTNLILTGRGALEAKDAGPESLAPLRRGICRRRQRLCQWTRI